MPNDTPSKSMIAGAQMSHVIWRELVVLSKILTPVAVILSVVAYFHDFVMYAVKANVAINGLIISAATYGVVLIVIRLVGAQIDFYVIERFGREAMQGVYMPHLLEQPWIKRRYVRHYLGHIAQTGGTLSSALQQNAIENELKALSSEYDHKLELPQFIVGFMIAMGLLGTFIGLLETLTGISSMLDGFGGSGSNMDEQFMKLVSELRKPLAGMGIAFSASMFGLVTSLMLAIMMIGLRRYINRVVSCARNVMHDLTELTRGSSGSSAGATQLTPDDIAAMMTGGKPGKPAPASIAEGESSLQDMVYQVHDTSLAVVNRVDGLTHKIDALLHALGDNLQASQKQNDLAQAVGRLGDVNEKMLRELEGISAHQLEQQKISQMLVESGANTNLVQGELVGAVVRGNDVNERMLREMREMAGNRTEQQKLLQVLIDSNNNTIRAVNGVIGAQRETQIGVTASLRELGQGLAKIEGGIQALGQQGEAVKQGLSSLVAGSQVGETIAAGVGHHTLLLETLVKEDRNLQKRLISIQQDIRERVPADAVSDEETPFTP